MPVNIHQLKTYFQFYQLILAPFDVFDAELQNAAALVEFNKQRDDHQLERWIIEAKAAGRKPDPSMS